MRKLYKISVFYSDSSFSMNWEGGVKVFRGSSEEFTRFIRKLRAFDDTSLPRSSRAQTYADMTDGIMNGSDTTIYVWSYTWKDVPNFVNHALVEV